MLHANDVFRILLEEPRMFSETIPHNNDKSTTLIAKPVGFILQLTENRNGNLKQYNFYNITSITINRYYEGYDYDMIIRTTIDTAVQIYSKEVTLNKLEIHSTDTIPAPRLVEITLDKPEDNLMNLIGHTGAYIAVPTNDGLSIYLMEDENR